MKSNKDLERCLRVMEKVHHEITTFFAYQNSIPQDMWDVMDTVEEYNKKFQDFKLLLNDYGKIFKFDKWLGDFKMDELEESEELYEDIENFCDAVDHFAWTWSIKV